MELQSLLSPPWVSFCLQKQHPSFSNASSSAGIGNILREALGPLLSLALDFGLMTGAQGMLGDCFLGLTEF